MNSPIVRGSLGLASRFCLAALAISALACSKGSIDGKAGAGGSGSTPSGTGGSPMTSGNGGSIVGTPGTGGTGDGTGGSVATMPGTGGTTGVPSGSGGFTGVPATLAGTCPTGFIACSGVCLESSLIGADCHPLTCAAPPAGTTAPTRASTSSRGFTWDVSASGGMTTVTFRPGKGIVNQTTTAVDIYTRVNADLAATKTAMTAAADGSFTWTTPSLKDGDDLGFYFHSTMTKQTLVNPGPNITPMFDTMWFHQKIGAARDPEPAYPITTKLAGRFRDRHPNEERFDHFVDTYFAGPTFDMTIVDNGDSIDVTIAPQASMDVQAVDFKNYEAMGSGQGGALPQPTPLCYTPPAIAALGVRATPMGNSVWKGHLGNLAYGQLVDWELTFVRSRTYYTEWFQYYVGSGHLQPKVMNPWAHAASFQSVTDVSTDEFGYAQHIPNITPTELADFISGKVLFEADFSSHVGYNPPTTYDCPRGATPGTKIPTIVTPPLPSPMFTMGNAYTNMSLATIPRPGFSSSSCFSCHHLDGKGQPADGTSMGNTLLKLFSSADGKTSGPDATYGTILDTQAPAGGTAEAAPSITWTTVPGTFADGTPFELRKPTFTAGTLRDGALGTTTHVSPRIPRPVFGLGLIEAVAPESIMALADPDDANHDGVSGRPNFITDTATGATLLGRFGWKAGTTSLREQAATAFVNDMGITSTAYPKHRCGANQAACTSAAGADTTPQLSDTDLDHIQSYLRSLSVPPRRNYEDPQAIAGKSIFEAIGCVKCHVQNLVTSSKAALPELRGIDIQPFSDLLLHDMGDGLADDAPVEEGTATGREWRTAPLWGNGTGTAVMFPAIDAFDPNDHPPPGGVYLHDGRARSITEAILWHGGEALPMREAFRNLSADARAQLLAYVSYPFADPLPLHPCPGTVGQ
ncbi:MAG TPA: di-heme oxidoredictase family protein [Polyangia bacterium]|nr:di-heme oxidoredictase family protein [Polyangia bacterium]